MGPIISNNELTIPTAVFTESFLSFIGLGLSHQSQAGVRWRQMVLMH